MDQSRPTEPVWPRPVPTIGDRTSAGERARAPEGWAFAPEDRDALARIMLSRRDIRRFRPDLVPAPVVRSLLEAAHAAPSVGHSQPWRFVVVTDAQVRARAAVLADRARLQQAAALDELSGRHLLDLDLEGIREAPVGVVVCCDRRAPAAGVLGRATFPDADMWSCACAIENLWLAARAHGLGVGWVTLFEPADLAGLVGAPDGVAPLGWLCVGWPDERPPTPGLERRGWSTRLPLDDVVIAERWPAGPGPEPPPSRIAPPVQAAVVAAHDSGDVLLSPPGSLGALDRAVDRILAVRPAGVDPGGGRLLIAAADHPVSRLGVTAYPPSVTRSVVEASVAGLSMGAVAGAAAGLEVVVVDAGVEGRPVDGAVVLRAEGIRGDLELRDGLERRDVDRLLQGGSELGKDLVAAGADLVAVGEVGVGNTTVAAAVAAALTGCRADELVGLGAGSDSAVLARKREVVTGAVARCGDRDPPGVLAALGGGEIVVLTGLILGAAGSGAVVVLDGLATGVAALAAVRMEPAVAAHLIAGQRSREAGHPVVLQELGLEPLVDLRLRSGEGVGAALAAGMLYTALRVRATAARTSRRL